MKTIKPAAFAMMLTASVLWPQLQFGGFAAAQPTTEQATMEQATKGAPPKTQAKPDTKPELDAPSRLPPASTTQHSVTLKDRTIAFSATAEAIALRNGRGEVMGEIVMTSFLKDSSEPRRRPVLFAVNGGPGASSAWLDLGALGPWRLPMSGAALVPSASAIALPNDETWLDFADLVFIDPVGTGFSRTVGKDDDKGNGFFSVDGDVSSIAAAMRQWLVKHERIVSPKYLVGESYAGIRGPKIVHELQTNQGVGLSGLLLVSPVLDFSTIRGPRHQALRWVTSLPSMAATVLDAGGTVSREALADVETYAAGDYLTDLSKGERDQAAIDRMAKRVSSYTGLDAALVKRLAARIDGETFRRERDRDKGMIGSPYDATVTGLDPSPNAATSFNFEDPFLDGYVAPLTSSMLDVYSRLKWLPERKYEVLSKQVNRDWKWGDGISPPQSLDDLRRVLALDPNFKLLVAHGYADLVTPYFGSKLLLDQLPPLGRTDRARLVLYPGGHMFYSRDASRIAFRKEVETMIMGVGP